MQISRKSRDRDTLDKDLKQDFLVFWTEDYRYARADEGISRRTRENKTSHCK